MNEEEREALQLAMRGCGSLLWLGRNMHNYGNEHFKEFLQAAVADAQRGYDAAAAVLPKMKR